MDEKSKNIALLTAILDVKNILASLKEDYDCQVHYVISIIVDEDGKDHKSVSSIDVTNDHHLLDMFNSICDEWRKNNHKVESRK